jgi:putative transposase
MYRVHLTEEQRGELKRRAHAPDVMPRTRDRLEMVRLSDAGWSIPKIARHLQISEVRVRFWVKHFLAGGFEALPDAPHPGQQSALTPAILAAVEAAIRQSGRTWSAQQVAAWVAEHHGVRRSVERVRERLREARLSYKRTNRSLKHKQNPQQIEQKRAELQALERGGLGSD